MEETRGLQVSVMTKDGNGDTAASLEEKKSRQKEETEQILQAKGIHPPCVWCSHMSEILKLLRSHRDLSWVMILDSHQEQESSL